MKKKIVFSLACMLLLVYGIKAQNNNQLSLQLSLNQIELGYQHKLFAENIWGEAFAGIGNQDINSRFDDFLVGIRLGFDAFSYKRNSIGIDASFEIYIPNNHYYTAVTPVIGAGIRYSLAFGKLNQHSLLINAGYQYGKQDYKQEYTSELINTSTISDFKIAPLYFSLGYGFNF